LPDNESGLTGHFAGYPELFADPKARIRPAQVRAALSVNRKLVRIYRQICSTIIMRHAKEVANDKNQGWDR